MKKLYLFLAAIAISMTGFSQGRTVDISLDEIISPKSIHSGVTIQVHAVFKNNGPDDVKMSDTIWYRSVLQTTPTQWLLRAPGKILKTGDTLHLRMFINGYTFTGTANSNFCVQTLNVNRSADSSKVELTTGANNSLCETIWFTDGTSSAFSLSKNIADLKIYPNPVVGEATVTFTNPEGAEVTAEVMDLTGKVVKTVDLGYHSVGEQSIRLNATDLESGIYFIKLNAGEFTTTRKFTVQ